MARILIAEDEAKIASFVDKGLTAAGHSTLVVDDGKQAAAIARDDTFDLLILDLGLPTLDGMSVLRAIRARGETLPVIILTARSTLESTVAGFEGGADDYVTKPFRFEELLARVTARLRAPQQAEPQTLVVGDVELDLRRRSLRVNQVEQQLSGREFALAEAFFTNPGQVLSREQLLSRAWGYDFDPGSNVVDVYVGYLRKKLGGSRLQTVRRLGYRLSDAVD
jgi:two-component system, OmpR family, copper resistance phosphate regulon response regulator CusR